MIASHGRKIGEGRERDAQSAPTTSDFDGRYHSMRCTGKRFIGAFRQIDLEGTLHFFAP
jgi:hypothetical protein